MDIKSLSYHFRLGGGGGRGGCPDGRVVKALPLTASHPSPLPGFEYQLGHLRKLPVTWS